VSKSPVSRRFVALSGERMNEWMATDLSQLDLLTIQIEGADSAERSTVARGSNAARSTKQAISSNG
jgi:hypothetical protein